MINNDTISRQAVLDVIAANCIWENEYNLTSSRIKDAVEQLPPVSIEKTGKWKKVMDKSWNYVWQCECGCRQGIATNYCPDCGAKMER